MAKKTNPFVHGDVLAPLADPWTAQSLIYVVADGPRLQFILAHGGDETAPDFAEFSP